MLRGVPFDQLEHSLRVQQLDLGGRRPSRAWAPAEVFVMGAATADFASGDSRPGRDRTRAAVLSALAGADLDARRIAAVFAAVPGAGPGRWQEGSGLDRLGLGGLRIGASGGCMMTHWLPSVTEALHQGWRAVENGLYDLVLCVACSAGPGRDWPDTRAVRPYAIAAQRYMSAAGATTMHLAKVTAKNRRHGALNPHAPVARPVDPGGVLRSEMIAWPLRRSMIAPDAGGAAAVILGSAAARRRVGGRAPRVRTSIVASERSLSDGRAARLAYAAAALGPDEVDCAEVDDVTAAAELAAYEGLQFAPGSQGPELIDSGFTALGGVLPVNTSGGRLSLGASTAADLAQFTEIVHQLRREAGPRQVPDARVGLLQIRQGLDGTGGVVTLTTIVTS
jgi:acetyl-CoA acetyltransferase